MISMKTAAISQSRTLEGRPGEKKNLLSKLRENLHSIIVRQDFKSNSG